MSLIVLEEQATPATPDTNQAKIYPKSDGGLYILNDAGVETLISQGTFPVEDTTSIVKGSVDATKTVRLEVDGLTTATTRVLTVPDKDITVAGTADIAVDANLSAAAQDAISKRHTAGTDTALGAVGTKNPPIDADKVLYRDSGASDALVTSTWTQVKAFFKTYYDTIYAALTHASQHTNGTDDIQSATNAQKGLATAAHITAIEANTAKVTNATHTGDVTGSTALTIATDAVTYAKMQNVSATDKILGRSTAGAGDVEEIACTAAGRAILDDADASAQRATLGALANVVEDTTPQLGGNVDVNNFKLVDANGNELLDFSATASAVNYLKLLNSATGNGVELQALGDDTDITLTLTPKGTGTVCVPRLHSFGTTANDVIQTDMGLDLNPVPNSVAGGIALIAEVGNVDAGVHYYCTSFYTALGETQLKTTSPTSVTTDALNGKVTVTIPVSSDPRVTGRKIYRSKAGAASYYQYLVATIANNTDTTYIDNIADSALGAVDNWKRENSTSKYITINGNSVFLVGVGQSPSIILGNSAGTTIFNGTATGGNSVFVGYQAGDAITSGGNNNGLGNKALSDLTTGFYNNAFGWGAGLYLTTGSNNSLFGHDAGFFNQTGSSNSVFGYYAGLGVSGNSYSNNSVFGSEAGRGLSTGSNNFLGGYRAGDNLTTGSNDIIIGYDIDAPAATSANILNIGNLIFGTGIDGTGTTLSTGGVCIGGTTPNQRLTIDGTMSLKEQAAANADTADYGQIWVGNTTPNELWFTDDAGTDTQLSSHPLDAPAALYTHGAGIDWIGKRIQKYLGKIYWQKIDGTVTIETFAEYNLRRKDAPGHQDLCKLDWNTVHHEKAVAKYQEEEVEATLTEAIEEVEIFEDVENKETISKYTFDEETGKVKKVDEELVTMVKLSTGKFKKQLKDGIRLDADTGKLYRKMTVLEATAMVKAKDIPEMPEWMAQQK